ncbi:ABC transporter substrate-binding protein [Variovorax sp. YR752]|uniref:ABC transporter substrate-binding protein n=1 Tax=Variovorax sp. YR752 TaxID=1884383 RepID=UPI003137A4FC
MSFASATARSLRRLLVPGLVAGSLGFAAAAHAEIHIGVTLSLTGPGASLGIPAENALKLWTGDMAGQKVRFTVLNDGTDSTTATKNAQKLISEEKVDLIIGSSLTPPSLAVVEIAGQAGVPVISMAGGGAIVLPQEGPRKWAFKLSPTEQISATMVIDHVLKNKGKTLATIGVSNSYGEGFLKVTEQVAAAKGVKLVATEKYAPTDQSVTAQIVKILAANPDAVYILSAGTPGALPQIELAKRGYKGAVYQTQGVANNDFLRVGGKDLEGGYMTVAPVLVAEQLPDASAVKKPAVDFVQRFETKYGAGSRSLFAATMWDGLLIIQQAAAVAIKKAQPGTAEFRTALRDAIEGTKEFVGSQGVFNMSPADHNGVDQRSQVMVRIENGTWKLQN